MSPGRPMGTSREHDDFLGAMLCARCKAPGKLQCPRCIAAKLPKAGSVFCSQECFKLAWPEHKHLHAPSAGPVPMGDESWLYCTQKGKGRSNYMPDYPWTGPLRPFRIGGKRQVPASIPRPDYAMDLNGVPHLEVESRQQNSAVIRSGQELEDIRHACLIGRQVLDVAHAVIRPGITTDEIDRIVHEATIERGAYPSPLNYYCFPKSVCTSVNEVICHGIPDQRELQDGDIINVDISVYIGGYHADLNETFTVGKVDEASKQLVKCAHDCLSKAIAASKSGFRYRDLGEVITKHAKSQGFSVVKAWCGHGIGDLFHCAPNVPHYTPNKAVGIMKVGHVFTIEPMINAGTWHDVMWPDGWTGVTRDGQRSAQFEHTMVVTESGVDVLTKRLPTSPPLWWEVEGVAATLSGTAA